MVGVLALAAAGLCLVVPAVGTLPRASAATPAWSAYVVSGPNSVTPLDTATNTPGTAIPVGSDLTAIAITPNGQTAYVVNNNGGVPGTVIPIDTATNTPGTAIGVGIIPNGIAITPNGQTAYVTNSNPFGSGSVTPIDTATNTAGTAIPVGNFPFGIAITPNGQTAYVANNASGTVTPIDTATNTAGTAIGVGGAPTAIAITPNGKTAYVANQGNTVTPIDTATNTAGAAIPVGSQQTAIAITPNGQTAYVVNSNFSPLPPPSSGTVTPIDTATNAPGTAITVGTNPHGLAITPNGRTAYVANSGSDSVTPIDTTTNTAGTAISMGAGFGIAITPDQAPVAHLSVTPNLAGQPTGFDASASTVAFGTIASYSWNFGDGTTLTTTSPIITHTYGTPATYTASVTETSSGGTSTTQVFTGQTMSQNGGPQAMATQSVTVQAAPAATAVGAEGLDGGLWVQSPQFPPGWWSLGGQIIAAPAVAAVPQTFGVASPLFIATGIDHSLWIRSLSQTWTSLTPGVFTYCLDNPGAVVTGPASAPMLTVACEGSDHGLYAATVPVPSSGLPAVTSWTSLGGALGAGPAVAPVNGVVTYFVTASFNNGQVWTTTNGTDWGATPWNCLGHPAAGIAQGGAATFFGCQGTDGQLWAGPMNNVVALGGAITPGPGLGITSTSDLFFAEANFGGGSVWFRTTTADWTSLGGRVVNGVGAVGLN